MNFAQGGSQTATATFNDWFNSTVVAVQGIGRADRSNGALDAGAGNTNPRLYEIKIPLSMANYSKTISSITFVRTGGSSTTSVLNIMAVSVDHQSCLPTTSVTVPAASITTTGATINWATVNPSQGYQYAITTSATPPASGTPHAPTTYSPNNLTPGTNYYVHVRNQCGAGSFSIWNTATFTTLPCPSAGTPVITNNAPGTVSFTWPGTSVPGVANYQWAVTPTNNPPTTWNTTSNTFATFNAVTPGSQYYIHVRSNCTNSQSNYTPLAFNNPFTPCAFPGNMVVDGINMHGAQIRWHSSPNVVNGYQYAVTAVRTPPTTGLSITTDTFFNATNLTEGQKYYVFVRTHCGTNTNNVANLSLWTIDSFTTTLTCQPALATMITNVTSHSANISWTHYAGVHSYEYVINTNPAVPLPGYMGAVVNFSHLAAASLFSGTNYYFHVRVRCNVTDYSPWATMPFTTQSVCTTPSVPSLMNIGATTATLSWSPVSGAQQYQYSVTTTSDPDPTSNTYTGQSKATALSLTPNTKYFFHVRAFCSPYDLSDWESTSFSTVSVSVPSLTGVDDYEVVVYPNPVRDQLTVEINGNVKNDATVSLYDMTGKLLRSMSVESGKVQVPMDDLAQGLYLLQYRDAEHVSGMQRVQKL